MNPYAVPPLLAALLNISLVCWVSVQAKPGRTKTAFLLWISWIAFWNFGIFYGYLLGDPEEATRWYLATVPLTISFLPTFFLHFAYSITRAKERWAPTIIVFAYITALIFTIAGTGSYFLIGKAYPFFWGFYPVAGSGAGLFALSWFCIVATAFYWIIKGVWTHRGHERNQLWYVLLSAIVGFSSGTTNFLPLYHVAIYPIGNLMNSLFSFVLAYAILEHGLMDVKLILRRGFVYVCLSASMAGFYVTLVSILQRLFGHYNLQESYAYYTAAIPITIVLSPAMKTRLEPWIEHFPFWKTHRYIPILQKFGDTILSSADLEDIVQRTLQQLKQIFLTSRAVIYLRHPNNNLFVCLGQLGEHATPFLHHDHPVMQNLLKNQMTSPNSAVYATEVTTDLSKRWPYSITAPLTLNGALLGCIALGEKESGNIYNSDDIKLLLAFMGPVTVALRNAQAMAELERKHQRLKKEQDMALLGVLATEMAHELAKPLTHIMNEGSRLEEITQGHSRRRVTNIGKEAQRAAEILDGFALLAPDRPLHRISVRLQDLLDEAVGTLSLQDDPSVHIEKKYGSLPAIPVNPGQMVQVFTNVIQNACQALQEEGTITLGLSWLLIQDQSFAEIAITDTGSGIPQSIQPKIFEPFFTTKQHQGGRGVGLAISRAMVERHDGTISIQSPIANNRGTKIIIRIPILKEMERP